MCNRSPLRNGDSYVTGKNFVFGRLPVSLPTHGKLRKSTIALLGDVIDHAGCSPFYFVTSSATHQATLEMEYLEEGFGEFLMQQQFVEGLQWELATKGLRLYHYADCSCVVRSTHEPLRSSEVPAEFYPAEVHTARAEGILASLKQGVVYEQVSCE